MVVCKYCMKTFRNKNSLGCHIWRWYFKFHDDIFIFCLFPVMCEKYLRFHKRGKELITKERGYQAPKALTPEVQQHSFDGASRFQEKNSALPSLTFQMSSNNGNETDWITHISHIKCPRNVIFNSDLTLTFVLIADTLLAQFVIMQLSAFLLHMDRLIRDSEHLKRFYRLYTQSQWKQFEF